MRLLILSDTNTLTTGRMLPAILELAGLRPGLEVAAIATAAPDAFRLPPARALRGRARAALVAALDRGTSAAAEAPGTIDLPRLAARHRVPVVAVPEGGVNGPAFARIVDDVRPDVTMSVYCQRILGPGLLARLGQTVNYHDGALPAYRGVKATSFSMYHGEPVSGFTFHRMIEQVDAGPVLLQGSVPLAPDARLRDVMHAKAAAAVAALPSLFDRLDAGEPGDPQTGPAGYFSSEDARAVTEVPHPEDLTADDLRRRARCFGTVTVTIDGRRLPVTRFRTARGPGRRVIRTRDGVLLEADRLAGLPTWLARG